MNPFSQPQMEKEPLLLVQLNALTGHHYEKCPEYARLLNLFYNGRKEFSTLADLPYLPVNLFKTQKLLSIPEKEIFKVLQSSGTTSSHPSKIYLDAATAHSQAMALAAIMQSFLGERRLPMLVIDHPNVIKDPRSYNARGAALMGMLNFGRDVCYALDEDMKLNWPAMNSWLAKHQDENILLFGLTFVIWEYFLLQLKDDKIQIPKGILVHSGGWKKMQEQAISNEVFKETLLNCTGISLCHNFYGMVEQVGSIYVECERGHLHCSCFSEILIRDPKSWQECSINKIGVIQTLSSLPVSYPGHSLLTEDLGMLLGVDHCPCQRKGKYFCVLGRIPQAEIRGCSDTFSMEKNSNSR